MKCPLILPSAVIRLFAIAGELGGYTDYLGAASIVPDVA
jgi:hypothetical protein